MSKPKGKPRRIIARVARYAVVGIILFMLTQLLLPMADSFFEWRADKFVPVAEIVAQNHEAEHARDGLALAPSVVVVHAHNEVVAVMQPVLVVHEHTVVRLICVVVPPPESYSNSSDPTQTAEFPNTRYMYGMWK